jgi:hypothetical protein
LLVGNCVGALFFASAGFLLLFFRVDWKSECRLSRERLSSIDLRGESDIDINELLLGTHDDTGDHNVVSV